EQFLTVCRMKMMGLEQTNRLHVPFVLVNFMTGKRFGFLTHQFVSLLKTATAQMEQIGITDNLLQQSLRPLWHHSCQNTSFYLYDHLRINLVLFQEPGSYIHPFRLMLFTIKQVSYIMKPAGCCNDEKLFIRQLVMS